MSDEDMPPVANGGPELPEVERDERSADAMQLHIGGDRDKKSARGPAPHGSPEAQSKKDQKQRNE